MISRLRYIFLALVAIHPVWAEVPVPQVWTLFDGEVQLMADGSRGPYRISERAIEGESECVWVDGKVQVRDQDYVVQADRGWITFFHMLDRGAKIVVRFRQMPHVVGPVYQHRVLQADDVFQTRVWYPSTRGDRTSVSDSPGLDIGGSKSFQVTVGSDQNHRVSQALQLHVAGEIANGVSVLAILSDRNLPLSEGGSTVGLRELDRVMFQVRGPDVAADLGDLDVRFDRTHLGRYHRQLQGAQVMVDRDDHSFSAVGAVSRGQWRSFRVVPVEGYQGPYQLPGGNGLVGGIVPESERVYLNGQLLKRGEQLDYVVDYERGVVTFVPERPIVSNSRILVDYQMLEDGRQSRLVGLDGQVSLGSALRVGSTLIRESDQAVLDGLATPNLPGVHRQVTALDATFAPGEDVVFSGEVAWSDRENGKGRALHFNGLWGLGLQTKGLVQVTGQFRQVDAGYEGFERLDFGRLEGRWGWQRDEVGQALREGDVGLRYQIGDASVAGSWGKRSGSWAAQRRSVDVQLPFGDYAYEHIGQTQGSLTRQRGRLDGGFGMFRSGLRFALEDATGDGVAGASVFYAADSRVLALEGIRLYELAWHVELGQKKWHWRSEIGRRRIRQLQTVWQDSLGAWSHTHQVRMDFKGWSVLGSYGQTVAQSGAQTRTQRVTHLGRTRIHYARPGYAHQVFYRVSSAGVQTHQPIYVEVGRGLGSYIWEDVDGDAEKDAAEFVPDVDGDYEPVYRMGGDFLPVREGVAGMHVEADLGRLLDRSKGFLAGLAIDLSVNADRQTTSNAIAPWQMLGEGDGGDIQMAQRDARMRVHLFRYHRLGSVRITGRLKDRIDRIFYGDGREALAETAVWGRLRLNRQTDVEAEVSAQGRQRDGASAFAFDITSFSGNVRGLWRPGRAWDLRFGFSGGRDQDGHRDLLVTYVALHPEVIRQLPGRGRLRGQVEWIDVHSNGSVPIFLGMANGNRVGQNWVWRLGVDYRFGRYVTAMVSYNGRKRPMLPVIHLGRMEMRAVF